MGDLADFFSDSTTDPETELLQGQTRAEEELRIARAEQRDLLNPFIDPGQRATGRLEEFAGAAQPLSLEALRQLGAEALAPPGLSPGEQFQLQETERGIGRLQSARGNIFSGRAGEELLERGSQTIAAQSEQRRLQQLATLLQIAPNLQGQLAGGGRQTAQTLAGLEGQIGGGLANLQFGGATQIAGLAAANQTSASNLLQLGQTAAQLASTGAPPAGNTGSGSGSASSSSSSSSGGN